MRHHSTFFVHAVKNKQVMALVFVDKSFQANIKQRNPRWAVRTKWYTYA